jgi:predicted nuclease of predicted toxin-antitoxin system
VTLLADESVEQQIVARLRQEGLKVLYVAEMQPGIPDDVVLDLSNQHGALLLTGDKDFGELVFRQNRVHAGVVLLRLAGLSSDRKAEIAATVIQARAAELTDRFTVISPGRIRIRRRL